MVGQLPLICCAGGGSNRGIGMSDGIIPVLGQTAQYQQPGGLHQGVHLSFHIIYKQGIAYPSPQMEFKGFRAVLFVVVHRPVPDGQPHFACAVIFEKDT